MGMAIRPQGSMTKGNARLDGEATAHHRGQPPQITQEHGDTAAYCTTRASSLNKYQQLTSPQYIQVTPKQELIEPQKSPNPQAAPMHRLYVHTGNLKQKRACRTATNESEAESEMEASCLIAKLFKQTILQH